MVYEGEIRLKEGSLRTPEKGFQLRNPLSAAPKTFRSSKRNHPSAVSIGTRRRALHVEVEETSNQAPPY